MAEQLIVVAGATGDLGLRIARALVARGAKVRALIRPGTDADRCQRIAAVGAEPVEADMNDPAALVAACRGAECVVSALNGLEPVIVEAQGRLLDAAVAAHVLRFIPSDFSIDYQAVPKGSNRNFDLRRRFRSRLDAAPLRATSIFNGAFADMLAGQMPLIVRPLRRVLYWNRPDIAFALTTKDDTAAFTAAAAMDRNAPRDLHIAGTQASAASLADTMTHVTGRRYRPLRLGSTRRLEKIVAVVRRLAPQKGAVFPAWQGMQYMHNMFLGTAPSGPLDNARYPDLTWTPIEQVLAKR